MLFDTLWTETSDCHASRGLDDGTYLANVHHEYSSNMPNPVELRDGEQEWQPGQNEHILAFNKQFPHTRYKGILKRQFDKKTSVIMLLCVS